MRKKLLLPLLALPLVFASCGSDSKTRKAEDMTISEYHYVIGNTSDNQLDFYSRLKNIDKVTVLDDADYITNYMTPGFYDIYVQNLQKAYYIKVQVIDKTKPVITCESMPEGTAILKVSKTVQPSLEYLQSFFEISDDITDKSKLKISFEGENLTKYLEHDQAAWDLGTITGITLKVSDEEANIAERTFAIKLV